MTAGEFLEVPRPDTIPPGVARDRRGAEESVARCHDPAGWDCLRGVSAVAYSVGSLATSEVSLP